jgi:hypothetical protein
MLMPRQSMDLSWNYATESQVGFSFASMLKLDIEQTTGIRSRPSLGSRKEGSGQATCGTRHY